MNESENECEAVLDECCAAEERERRLRGAFREREVREFCAAFDIDFVCRAPDRQTVGCLIDFEGRVLSLRSAPFSRYKSASITFLTLLLFQYILNLIVTHSLKNIASYCIFRKLLKLVIIY